MSIEKRKSQEELAVAIVKDNCISFTLKSGKYVAQHHPIAFGWWVLGILLFIFAKGSQVDHQTEQELNVVLDKLEPIAKRMYAQEQKMEENCSKYNSLKGYFWTCNDECTEWKQKCEIEQGKYQIIQQQYQNQQNLARKTVGIWSEHGVNEAKGTFWQSFSSGKKFSKDMSYYDLIFGGLSFAFNSDDGVAEIIFRIFYQIIQNLVFGVIYAFISFFWNLWSVVSTFSAGPSGIIFYFLAFTAGTSVLFSTLWGIFLAARAPVTTLMAIAENNPQFRQQQQRPIRYTQ